MQTYAATQLSPSAKSSFPCHVRFTPVSIAPSRLAFGSFASENPASRAAQLCTSPFSFLFLSFRSSLTPFACEGQVVCVSGLSFANRLAQELQGKCPCRDTEHRINIIWRGRAQTSRIFSVAVTTSRVMRDDLETISFVFITESSCVCTDDSIATRGGEKKTATHEAFPTERDVRGSRCTIFCGKMTRE